ncbi:MAG: 23S rRNA (uracil(1939)-C(5))-methyltransferase RlmD [Acidaminococcaceae bacterium]|nr:23S rRNA (uracil(1939)-C(5))-methyltransferase RlmD [Acidaminococcaceae bacterium]
MKNKTINVNFTKNSILEMQVTGLGSSGEGVGKVQGFTFFVPGALAGEKIRFQAKQVKKSYGIGELTNVLEPSPERVKPVCPVYKQCGGCQLQHLSYEGQLTVKRQQVIDALERLGHFKGIKVEKTLGDDDPWHYRNKMQVPVASGKKGSLDIGCFAQATHRVINVEECFIQKKANNAIAAVVRAWMKEYKIPALEEDARRGIVRHVMGRVGVATGEVMAVLITNSPMVPHIKDLGKMLREAIPGFKTLVQNVNTRHTNVIMGEKSRIVTGPGFIQDSIGTLTFNISPESFFQVNSEQAAKLYGEALKAANLTSKETVVDVYCGTGTITLFLAQKAARAIGIEIVPSAIKDARINARNNKIANAQFVLGDAAVELPKLAQEGIKADVIVLDPPRAGCDQRVINAIAAVKPKKVVYVSCNPASLARDAELLCKKGYKINKVQPVDLFPQTHHVETVVLMSRKN